MLNRLSRPTKPAAATGSDPAGEHFLAHRRGLAEHADAGRDVEAQHPPDQPELRRLQRVVDVDVVLGDQLLRDRGRRVALGPPARRRHAHDRGADPHEAEIDHAEARRRLPSTPTCVGVENLLHQPDRERRGDERAAAEAHDRHAGRHAGPVGEPFDQGRDRRDVAEPEADAAEHAVAEIDDPQLVQIDAERGDEEAAAPAKARGEHRAPRAAVLDPAAEHRRRRAQKEDGDGEDPAEIGELPVVRRRLDRCRSAWLIGRLNTLNA